MAKPLNKDANGKCWDANATEANTEGMRRMVVCPRCRFPAMKQVAICMDVSSNTAITRWEIDMCCECCQNSVSGSYIDDEVKLFDSDRSIEDEAAKQAPEVARLARLDAELDEFLASSYEVDLAALEGVLTPDDLIANWGESSP